MGETTICGIQYEAEFLSERFSGDTEIPTPDYTDPLFNLTLDSNSPLYLAIPALTTEMLTERKVGGNGVFDALMDGFKCHLVNEFDKGRITGAEYSKTYIALTESAMGNAVQFLLGKDNAYWQAQIAQIQAVNGMIALETARIGMIKAEIEARTAGEAKALMTLKLATESVNYCISKFNLDYILPQQEKLLYAQTNTQTAQTFDYNVDGSEVKGVLGKQKELTTQQIISYQRDAEVKAAKLFTDAWITQKTIDEGLVPPPSFTNATIDEILVSLKSNNGL